MNADAKINATARTQALAVMEEIPVGVTGVVEFRAGGNVLVIGGAEAPAVAATLPPPLVPRVLSLDVCKTADMPPAINDAHSVSISGYLGRFLVNPGNGSQPLEADMVLDLSSPPLLSATLKPPGYVSSPGAGSRDSRAAVEQLSALVGTFDKPQFFDYDPDRCAHGRNGVTACTRCIDACPAQAIRGHGEGVEIDPYLCQGGGVCASVCPSGAIRYAYPRPGDLGKRIRAILKSYREAGGRDPVLVFHAEGHPPDEWLESCSNLLPVAVEEVASVGPEIWLLSLAFGARRVFLMDEQSEPEQVRVGLGGQLEMIGEILVAMGYPAAAVSRVSARGSVEPEEGAMPSMVPAVHAVMEDKRGNFYLALDHLHARAVKSKTMVNLSAGDAFGAVFVEPKACTLCMACVSVCPGNALQGGGGEPRLGFLEANCIQCGLCTRTCPEDAIWITPRLLFDREYRNTPRVLHQEEPFCCVTCGKPFATRSVIDHVMSKLSGHSMYRDDRARQRLMMCEDCRVVDVVQDQEAMRKGQIPP
jgi:ferredoxin